MAIYTKIRLYFYTQCEAARVEECTIIEKGNKKEKLRLSLKDDADFSKAVLSGSRIELFSNTQVVIEGCLGVIEYNDNYLKLRLSGGAVVLMGMDFDIVSFEEKTICIKGKRCSCSFDRYDKLCRLNERNCYYTRTSSFKPWLSWRFVFTIGKSL